MLLSERFTTYIQTNALSAIDEYLLLAVSGGIDSMVMAHLFHAAGWRFGIVHCNFKLRGAASDGDERFVQNQAEAWKVPVFTTQFDTQSYASEKGVSIQMAARDLRYAFFEEIRESSGYDVIAIGHNLNDSVETALFNFSRGTGLRGLAGIQPKAGNIIRPLLFATRQEIEAYAVAHGISWREDSSNQTDDYARNFIRHQIVPQLEVLNPGFWETAGRNFEKLRGIDANYEHLAAGFWGKSVQSIDKDKLSQFPAPVQMLRTLLRPYGFSDEQCRQVIAGLSESGNAWLSSTGHRLVSDRNNLLITTAQVEASAPVLIEGDDLMVRLPDQSRLFFTRADPGSAYPDGVDAIVADADLLQYPLTLRLWKPGDVFQPFGMQGRHQKLQDFFTNQKLSILDKEQTWILENGNGAIIWVVGYRLDERFKVTDFTRNSIKVSRVDLH
jgi:tRNA(Ile)-lysidine synthase